MSVIPLKTVFLHLYGALNIQIKLFGFLYYPVLMFDAFAESKKSDG